MAIAVRMDLAIDAGDYQDDDDNDGVDDHDGPPIPPNDNLGERQLNRNGQFVRNRVAHVDLTI